MYNTISLSQFILPKPQRKELLDRFKIQLDYYSNESDLEFKCFNVLKIEYEDRQEVFPFNNYDGWYLFNKSGCIKVDNTINRKHNNWLNEKPRMEGVVIKPFESNLTEVIPALKVRNKEFLRLIYGPYYDSFLSFYINSKKCKGKRKASIKQWQLGFDMLSIPYNNILKNDFQKLVKLFMTCDRKYRNLDFRL
jgi:hypothetical protein